MTNQTLDGEVAAALNDPAATVGHLSELIKQTEKAIYKATQAAQDADMRALDPTVVDMMAREVADENTYLARRYAVARERLQDRKGQIEAAAQCANQTC